MLFSSSLFMYIYICNYLKNIFFMRKKNIKFFKKYKKLELNLIVCRIISLFRNQEYCAAYTIKYNFPKIMYPINFKERIFLLYIQNKYFHNIISFNIYSISFLYIFLYHFQKFFMYRFINFHKIL